MNGWRLGAAIVLAFGGGWVLASWRHLILEQRLRVRLLLTEANQDHLLCRAEIQEMAEYIARQKVRLNEFAAGADLPDEAEQYLRERGGS